MVVNPRNDFASCLTTEELKRIWAPGSTIGNWRQVREGFPDQPLTLYGPNTAHGTFDYFTEAIMGEAGASRPDYTGVADYNVASQGIAGDKNALGYFGYSYYVENRSRLKLLAIDSGDGCIEPTQATIESGQYTPLARPLFIYVSRKSLERPEVKAFVEFYMENAAELASEVGYIAEKPSLYADNLATIRGD